MGSRILRAVLGYFNTNVNKTGLQPVSRPVERILEFFQKGFNAKNGAKICSKNV